LEHDQAMESMAAEKYVLGELHDDDRDQFEEHFFSCAHCAQDVRDLSGITQGVKELLKSQPKPSQQRAAAGWLPSWIFPGAGVNPLGRLAWATAMLALLAGAGYQNMQLRQLALPVAAITVVAQGESRGEKKAVSLPTPKTPLNIQVDLPEDLSGELQWELRTYDSNKLLAQGTGEAPKPPDTTFTVDLRSSLAPGAYTLTLASAGNETGKTWPFRFTIAQAGHL
jgi:hypothetical protein